MFIHHDSFGPVALPPSLHWCCPRSTCDPPHEQWLGGLEVGGVSSVALYVSVVVHYPTLSFIALCWRCLCSTHDPPHEQLLMRLGMGVSFLVPLHPPFSLAVV
jgi:hypothetical protein